MGQRAIHGGSGACRNDAFACLGLCALPAWFIDRGRLTSAFTKSSCRGSPNRRDAGVWNNAADPDIEIDPLQGRLAPATDIRQRGCHVGSVRAIFWRSGSRNALHRRRCASAIRARPSAISGPVESPTCAIDARGPRCRRRWFAAVQHIMATHHHPESWTLGDAS
jgi:hypothetical protein